VYSSKLVNIDNKMAEQETGQHLKGFMKKDHYPSLSLGCFLACITINAYADVVRWRTNYWNRGNGLFLQLYAAFPDS
jgi:hypothetical protein